MSVKVLHINFSDEGGAAIAAMTLHETLVLSSEIESSFLCLNLKNAHEPSLNYFSHRRIYINFFQKLWYLYIRARFIHFKNKRIFRKIRNKNDFLSLPYATFDLSLDPLYQNADVIHLHWTSNFLDWPSFFQKNKKPIVWTLHDRNPFSGISHCASNFPDELNSIESTFATKKAMWIKKQNIHVVGPSSEYTKASQKSKVLGEFPHQTITHGIDQTIFHPIENARAALNLPGDKVIVLSIVSDLSRELKGFAGIVEFTKSHPEILFVLIGKMNPSLEVRENVIYTGEIKDRKILNTYYNAADVVISNSLEESFGLTIAESLMAGTCVFTRKTGFVGEKNSTGLNVFDRLEEIDFTNPTFETKKEISESALQFFALDDFSRSYVKLYQSLVVKI